MYFHVFTCTVPAEDIRSSTAGIKGSCEPPETDAKNQTYNSARSASDFNC